MRTSSQNYTIDSGSTFAAKEAATLTGESESLVESALKSSNSTCEFICPDSHHNQHARHIESKVWNDIQYQLTRPVLPEILYNLISEVISHGYIMIFAAVFPLTALLVFINNFFKGRLEYFTLLNAQRPHPFGISIYNSYYFHSKYLFPILYLNM